MQKNKERVESVVLAVRRWARFFCLCHFPFLAHVVLLRGIISHSTAFGMVWEVSGGLWGASWSTLFFSGMVVGSPEPLWKCLLSLPRHFSLFFSPFFYYFHGSGSAAAAAVLPTLALTGLIAEKENKKAFVRNRLVQGETMQSRKAEPERWRKNSGLRLASYYYYYN